LTGASRCTGGRACRAVASLRRLVGCKPLDAPLTAGQKVYRLSPPGTFFDDLAGGGHLLIPSRVAAASAFAVSETLAARSVRRKKADRRCRIKMRVGDIADRVDHGEYDQAKSKCHSDVRNRAAIRIIDDDCSGSSKTNAMAR
jgi:hypothetical protein